METSDWVAVCAIVFLLGMALGALLIWWDVERDLGKVLKGE